MLWKAGDLSAKAGFLQGTITQQHAASASSEGGHYSSSLYLSSTGHSLWPPAPPREVFEFWTCCLITCHIINLKSKGSGERWTLRAENIFKEPPPPLSKSNPKRTLLIYGHPIAATTLSWIQSNLRKYSCIPRKFPSQMQGNDKEVCVLSQACVHFINLKNWMQILTVQPRAYLVDPSFSVSLKCQE